MSVIQSKKQLEADIRAMEKQYVDLKQEKDDALWAAAHERTRVNAILAQLLFVMDISGMVVPNGEPETMISAIRDELGRLQVFEARVKQMALQFPNQSGALHQLLKGCKPTYNHGAVPKKRQDRTAELKVMSTDALMHNVYVTRKEVGLAPYSEDIVKQWSRGMLIDSILECETRMGKVR